MIVNSSSSAQIAADQLDRSQSLMSKSLTRLSSGRKIVNPSEDPAALAVSARFEGQIQRLSAAKTQISSGMSFSQTQDGYLTQVGSALGRMSELAVMAQDATKTDLDRAGYNDEFSKLAELITNVGNKQFNKVDLFSGTSIEVATGTEGNTLKMAGIDLRSAAYTGAIGASVATAADASQALDKVSLALNQLGLDRADVASYQSALHIAADQLNVSQENLSAANSSIADTDMAAESTEYARQNLLSQSATAILAQANLIPQTVLKILQ